MSVSIETSQTASDYIASQLRLEEDAREALPYQFDTCTKPLGSIRQSVFACLTCSPPPATPYQQFKPAGICYSCSISCHGDHNLVELFTKRHFTCDCGTTRYTNSRTPCQLRLNATTGRRGGVLDEESTTSNKYDQNYSGRFCGCNEEYDHEKEKGTMFQCLGLGSIDEGGCGEDWWHPECLMGVPRQGKQEQMGDVEAVNEERETHEDSVPGGFPHEDDFDHFICYKCVTANPWIKQYAGTAGFLPAVVHATSTGTNRKRKAEDDEEAPVKRARSTNNSDDYHEAKLIARDDELGVQQRSDEVDDGATHIDKVEETDRLAPTEIANAKALHEILPPAQPEVISLFLQQDFRDHFCRCQECFPKLTKFPQLLEEEESYEPPLSESDIPDEHQSLAGGSIHSGSLLERGEAALSSMDRVRAIEGVMAYNHVRDKVKEFLQPFAESGKAVGAEDIKAYFAQLRGDET